MQDTALISLKKVSRMEENYEVTLKKVPDGLKIGDTVYVIDNTGEMYLESRVLKIEVRASEGQYTVTLGEYLMKSSGIEPVSAIVDEDTQPTGAIIDGMNLVNGTAPVWMTANLSGFFVKNDGLRYRKDERRVSIQGIVSPVQEIEGGDSRLIFVLPEDMWPSVPIRQVMVGSGINQWTLGIDLNGNVTFSNYGTTGNVPCSRTEKLYINLSYYV